MNGGFAFKLRLPKRTAAHTVEHALRALAEATGLSLVVRTPADAPVRKQVAERRAVLGFKLLPSECLLLPAEDLWPALHEFGAALATQLDVAMALVVDSDEGAELIESWHDGDTLKPDTGQTGWQDSDVTRQFEFIAPPFEAVPEPQARRLLVAINAARPPNLREVKAEFVKLSVRPKRQALSHLFHRWKCVVALPVGKQLTVFVDATDKQLISRANLEALKCLDRHQFSARELRVRRPVKPSQLEALGKGLGVGVKLLGLARRGVPGFWATGDTWDATVQFHGRRRSLRFEGSAPEAVKQTTLAQLLKRAVSEAQATSEQHHREDLQASFQAQLARGDWAAAALTYRQLHAGFFAHLTEPQAGELARSKVEELAGLSGFTSAPQVSPARRKQ